MSSHNINTISLQSFKNVLLRYASAVPDKLRDLDVYRYSIIPDAYAERSPSKHLTRTEVEQLVEWKLKHGTFRPKLLQLVQSNTPDSVQETTLAAFELLPDVTKALKVLTDLKGIGPATASLLLSVASPDKVPFFSDELFRWCMWNEPGAPKGWQRKIKYTAKEYESLLAEVRALRTRLGVRAVDAEKVAWALGKEAIDVDDDTEVNPSVGSEEKEYPLKEARELLDEAKPEPEVTKGTKRKAKPVTEGARKSMRTKK
ncbi:hypothetical protein BDU57DRAFT_70503 [Ampelomyces quisqualis]|uniref:Uncharacterized protein n=1 Tax=Ampelomyces quisqualis TaxID=50730 RepID=A0A6A5R884_AMPQU|nr:hypothetical protein BDU57DRAFT_70503 [Ampelomyces quisqualis]